MALIRSQTTVLVHRRHIALGGTLLDLPEALLQISVHPVLIVVLVAHVQLCSHVLICILKGLQFFIEVFVVVRHSCTLLVHSISLNLKASRFLISLCFHLEQVVALNSELFFAGFEQFVLLLKFCDFFG